MFTGDSTRAGLIASKLLWSKDKLKQPPQVHYGGPACFSCRAFFRRAHQNTKVPNFKCKLDEKCMVTVKTRRKCQKCRYNICLQVGMKPQAVLTDDQKKVRFRNSLQKKSKLGEFLLLWSFLTLFLLSSGMMFPTEMGHILIGQYKAL